MLQNERFDEILRQLRTKGTVKVSELAESLNTSESTIRRDISSLAGMAKLQKVFGGAISRESDITAYEYDVATKSGINVKGKEAIAKRAASLIEPDDFVFIDAGTTTEKMIDFIEQRRAVYVTNGIVHGKKLTQKGLKAYIIGGQIKSSTEAIAGAEAAAGICKYNFTKCFVGANGIDTLRGFTTPDIDEALVKTNAVTHSYKVYILADSTKFGHISSVTFADISSGCIITDELPNGDYRKHTEVIEADK